MNRNELLDHVLDVTKLEEISELVMAIRDGCMFSNELDDIDSVPRAAHMFLMAMGSLQAAESQLELAAIEMASAKEEN